MRRTLLIDTTSNIYSRVCKEIGYSVERLMIDRSNGFLTEEQYNDKKIALDDLYCKYLCELDTIILEDLLVGHVNGDVKRAARTIDIVQKELLERAINEDAGKSNTT
jgi:hypothetical protein